MQFNSNVDYMLRRKVPPFKCWDVMTDGQYVGTSSVDRVIGMIDARQLAFHKYRSVSLEFAVVI